MILLAILFLALAQAADYLYQADMHGWTNPLWANGYRAPKWGAWDWIPHDGWHWAQTVRNFGDCTGVAIAALWLQTSLVYLTHSIGSVWLVVVCLAVSLAIRAALRGLFFSLPYRYLKQHPEMDKTDE